MENEKFCLKWNDFEKNISAAFRDLREDKDFFDVTLACGDEQIQAHKVILSACSPFFRSILRRNPHQHPLLYLGGVKFSNLQSVLMFMYHGEVNIAQQSLNSFLAVAENLQVKGLTQRETTNTNNRKASPEYNSLASGANDRINDVHTSQNNLTSSAVLDKKESNTAPADYDDVEEVVPVKAEPRDGISTHPTQLVYQPGINHSNVLTPVDEQGGVYHDELYDDYAHYDPEPYQRGRETQYIPPANQGTEGE